ncbi:protein of unknown function (plasmid) [Denitratisoma oestradiolicum]|uniref:Uncharacterized protein n=1 Tax=Denitratisoma oestradiolicum TaxID=311182 RepID=A0A6S6Y6W9_9PROT|nr:protein of unknown function [Denitratisoma oestradiolicum]
MQKTMMEQLKGAASRFWDQTVLGNTPDVGKNPAPLDAANELTKVYGLHNILRYDQFDPERELFYNDNSVAFAFEVLAQTGADDEMANRLATLFTPIPPHFGVQWCLFGSPILDQQYQAYKDQRHIAVDRGETSSFFLELAERRINYIRRTSGRPLFPNDNFMIKNIRLMISVTKAGSHTDSKLVEEMTELRETIRASLRTANLPAYTMNADGLIDFLWPILNPEVMFNGQPFPALGYDEGKPLKHQLTDFGQHVRVKADEILSGCRRPPRTRKTRAFPCADSASCNTHRRKSCGKWPTSSAASSMTACSTHARLSSRAAFSPWTPTSWTARPSSRARGPR